MRDASLVTFVDLVGSDVSHNAFHLRQRWKQQWWEVHSSEQGCPSGTPPVDPEWSPMDDPVFHYSGAAGAQMLTGARHQWRARPCTG